MNRDEHLAACHAELQAGIQQVLRFERYYARRLRETSTARRPTEMNVVEAGIFHELRDGPCPVAWLRERLVESLRERSRAPTMTRR